MCQCILTLVELVVGHEMNQVVSHGNQLNISRTVALAFTRGENVMVIWIPFAIHFVCILAAGISETFLEYILGGVQVIGH